jgi:putative phosphoesterase
MSGRKRAARTYPPLRGRLDRIERELPLTLGVISDTHLHARDAGRLPTEILDLFARFQADLIVHGGDIVDQAVIDRLEAVAPVIAVHGNNEPLELWKTLPERIILTAGRWTIGIVHGHGGPTARKTVLTAFPVPVDFAIYGHSHIPMIEAIDGVRYFNPGSPTDRRWAPHFGIGIVRIDEREIRPELILFDTPAALRTIDPLPEPGASE